MTIITKNERLEGLLNNNDLPHNEKYEAIVEELGYENVKKCLPFSIDVLTEAYEYDKHFNNLPFNKWDLAGGFISEITNCQQTYRQVNSPLAELLIANRIRDRKSVV